MGKTTTAMHREGSLIALDDPGAHEIVLAGPRRFLEGTPPIVIDEWQHWPGSWDLVRRAVDQDPSPGRFMLTGSVSPVVGPAHSGAGGIVPMQMRPLSMAERGVETPSVSTKSILAGNRPELLGETHIALEDYVSEILNGGFPGMRATS